jgi:signal transduction histidine kinase
MGDELQPPKAVNQPFKRRKQLEQDMAHITEEMYRRNKELADTNRVLSLLRTIDSLVLESHDSLKVLCGQISSEVANSTEYPFVSILINSQGQLKSNALEVFGWGVTGELQGRDISLLQQIKINPDLGWLKSPDRSLFLQIELMATDQLSPFLGIPSATLATLRANLPIRSVYLMKLMARQKLVGVMVIGFVHPVKALSPTQAALLDRLGEAVGVAVDNKLLFEENQLIVQQLQKSNEKLKALDETKDEFISMASHQLRTPLTSVKGYVSMVLEGDAGPVNEQQKKLLDQAFFSSQRMVYLIADLLNISRLKTGKFIIDAKPTQLAEVVEGELQQLVNTAKNHHNTLVYNKPPNFPVLMLDETKIRQVIMNFVDNAIYYTPAGGTVTISLVDRGESIELTVTDTGIGVPKAEQHNLFTKFFRADNAKKTRPDGTGLGLFMAQKVIVASGGAILFRSEEGKGSTFGFTFSKAKLKVPDHTDPQITIQTTSI